MSVTRSRRRRWRATLGIAALCLVSGCQNAKPVSLEHVHSAFFQDKQIYERMYASANTPPVIHEEVVGAVVPHHLAVGPAFAEFYQSLASQDPDVVVVIGPNHFDAGPANILTTTVPYDTPYGLLQIDTDLIQKLTDVSLIQENDIPFAREHSISAEVAFIKKTFPRAKLVPVILKAATSADDSKRVGTLLAQILPKNSLVLASIDFSHYLPELAADFHDQTSLAAMQNADADRFNMLEIDSTPTLHALFTYLRQKDALHVLSENHTNSASYVHQPELAETTSHFFVAFGNGQPQQSIGMSVLAFGDAMFDRGMRPLLSSTGDLVLGSMRGQENRFFRGSDVVMLNLEGPITTAPALQKKPVTFHFDAQSTLALLKSMNVNVVNLANNHSLDSGSKGLQDTIASLNSVHIDHAGGDHACTSRTIDGQTLMICGFDDSNHQLDLDAAVKAIQEATATSDRVLVNMHWGVEYEAQITDRQQMIAHTLIDAGADAIIGHHPHVIQPLEIYKSAPIVYSLGNFIFDQTDPATKMGLGAGIFFGPEKTILYLYPFHTNLGRPELFAYDESIAFLQTYLEGVPGADPALIGKLEIPRF